MYDSQDVYDSYASLNGTEAADAVDDLCYAAVAKYMNLNDYGIDVEADRIALGTLDVFRLTFDGEFAELGFLFDANSIGSSEEENKD